MSCLTAEIRDSNLTVRAAKKKKKKPKQKKEKTKKPKTNNQTKEHHPTQKPPHMKFDVAFCAKCFLFRGFFRTQYFQIWEWGLRTSLPSLDMLLPDQNTTQRSDPISSMDRGTPRGKRKKRDDSQKSQLFHA